MARITEPPMHADDTDIGRPQMHADAADYEGRRCTPMSQKESAAFEECGCSLTSAHAHRDNPVSRLPLGHRICQRAHEPRAGHSEGVADGNRTAVNIQAVHWNAKPVTAVHDL